MKKRDDTAALMDALYELLQAALRQIDALDERVKLLEQRNDRHRAG